jgi:predicted flap endonuclease-1-like 5' DNA nuclease
MSNWLKDDIFKTLAETQKRLWEGLSTVLPSLPLPEGIEGWREAYLKNLDAWEGTVQKALRAESAWLEQWARQIASEQGIPEPIVGWTRQVEEVVQSWVQTQRKLWDDCFELLRSSSKAVQQAPAKPEGAAKLNILVAPASSPAAKSAAPSNAEPAVELVSPLGKDDLKTLVGVGPAMEKKLNDHGIVSYRQLAQLSDEDIKQLETAITKFSGRIRRDNWIEQAKEQHFQKYNERL